MAMFRKIAFKILGGTIVITIVVMWLCLPFYWGSCEYQKLAFDRQ